MTDNRPAGATSPPTDTQSSGRAEPGPHQPASRRSAPKIKVSSVPGFLAVVPHLLGFHPQRSMVVVGLDARRGRVMLAFRYDLPDPPDAARSGQIAEHASVVLRGRGITTAIAVGYGEAALVTPVAEPLDAGLRSAGITLRDLLRVADGRYWSYTCQVPACCPPEGVTFDATAHPAAEVLAAAGIVACPGRESLAATLAPVTGPAAESMAQATRRAQQRARAVTKSASGAADATEALADAGRAAVREAIATYRRGGRVTDPGQLAWLAVTLTDLRVRDDAWARMDPRHRAAHRRLWTDLVRRAEQAYVPAAASLLAFTAWQSGDGALANIAIERALAADPGYSMAHLIGQALDAGLPPSAARLPMTPEEVAASYAGTRLGGAVPPARRASRRPSA